MPILCEHGIIPISVNKCYIIQMFIDFKSMHAFTRRVINNEQHRHCPNNYVLTLLVSIFWFQMKFRLLAGKLGKNRFELVT